MAAGRDVHATPDEIARAALALVDREGIDALTMRRLAAELHLSPRGLYHHFADKGELLDRMTELVWDEAGVELTTNGPPDPADWIVHACVVLRRTFLAHPDMALYMTALPRPGPRLAESIEGMAAVVAFAGFPKPDEAFHLLATFTVGSVALQAARRLAGATVHRDGDALRAWAHDQLGHLDPATDPRAAVMAALLPGADDERFEAELRFLVEVLRRPEGAYPAPGPVPGPGPASAR